MAEDDLKEFERSLRQLEFMADASEQKKKPATRNQDRSPYNDLSPTPYPPSDAKLVEISKSQEGRGGNNSGRLIKETQGGMDTAYPSNDSLMIDSVLGGTSKMYEKMKRNMTLVMEKQERQKELITKQETLKKIEARDEDAKKHYDTFNNGRRRNNSALNVKADNRSKPAIKASGSPQNKRHTYQDTFSSPKKTTQQRQKRTEKDGHRSSPRFNESKKINDSPERKSNRSLAKIDGRGSVLSNKEIEPMRIPEPSVPQIKEQHRMNALKVVDIYRQLQNSPLLNVSDLQENATVAAEIDLSNMNNDASPRTAGRQLSNPDESQREFLSPQAVHGSLAARTQVRNPTNSDIISSTFAHVLGAFAIAEAQQDIFLRMKTFLYLSDYDLPKLNGIYQEQSFDEVRKGKTRYLHHLFTHALQTSIHANWIAMAHSILIHCKENRLTLGLTKLDLSVLLSNHNYELMNLLIEYGANFENQERSIEAEHLVEKRVALQQQELAGGSIGDGLNNTTGFRRAPVSGFEGSQSSMAGTLRGASPFKARSVINDNVSRAAALSNLDHTVFGQSNRKFHDVSMVENLKRGLILGHSSLSAVHFFRQLYEDRQSLGPSAENHERFQQQIRKLIKALCDSKDFEQVIPLLVLRGNRDLVYDMLTDRKNSQYNFELSFEIQKILALEFFCYSVSQEQLDEAINVLSKFHDYLTKAHRKRCLNEIMGGMKRSAAFIELKFYLLSKYYAEMTQSEATELLDIFENRLIATYMHQSQHRVALIQNLNSLRTTLLTLFMMIKVSKLIPYSRIRVANLATKLIDKQVQILEQTPNSDFNKIILSCKRKDIFDNDVLYYLAYTKPGKLLDCQVIQRLIDKHWSSSYANSSSMALLHHSTCSQIVFHSRLKIGNSFKHLFLGKDSHSFSNLAETNDHLLMSVNFKGWRKGMNVRFLLDSFLTLVFLVFTHYVTFAYMKADVVINPDTTYLLAPIVYFIGPQEMQQLNKIENSGFFLAFTYCFFCTAYFLLAILSQQVLFAAYKLHTGYKKTHSQVSLSKILVYIAVAIFAIVYLVACIKEPNYYQSIEKWGELIDDELILRFNANLHNFNQSNDMPVSVRFWPFLVITVLWVYFCSRLQMHRRIGAFIIMLRLAVFEFAKLILFWVLSLVFFASVTVVWFGEFEGYKTFSDALESLYSTPFGMKDFPEDLESVREGGLMILHGAFIVVNIIGFISFLTAMMTQVLVQSHAKLNQMQNGYFVERLPTARYSSRNMGWITTIPLIFAPLFLIFVYPCNLLVEKIAKGAGKKFNLIISSFLYLPICLTQLIVFMMLNLALIPLAYVAGIYQLVTQNPYRDSKEKRSRVQQVLIFIFLGLPLLFVSQFPNVFYCLKSLYAPPLKYDALASEKARQAPVNTRNIQRLYQTVSSELLERANLANKQQEQIAFGPRKAELQGGAVAKQLLERLRKTLGVQNCVKMLFFGEIPGFSRGSARFMAQLRREDQTIHSQLESYNLLKTAVIAHKETSGASYEELNLGLLFQYLQEIKMKITATKSIKRYQKGRELSSIDFIMIDRSSMSDEISREFLLAEPNRVLKVLQAEELASQSLKENFLVGEMKEMQEQILHQMRRQAMSQILMSGATMEQLRDNQSMLSQSIEQPEVTSALASARKLKSVNQYQVAIAQQEAVYALNRLMKISKEKTTPRGTKDRKKAMPADSARAVSQLTNQPPSTRSLTDQQPQEDFKVGFLRKKTMTSKA